jgi:hypothetical protein
MIQIDKETYKTEKGFYKSKHDKTQIILGGSLRMKNYHIKRMEYKYGGIAKEWCTYSIDREGNIFQHYDPKYYSDFMGDKEIDKKSISIVLENMGMLFYDFESNQYLNWSHDICDPDLVYERKWNGHTYWEKYSSEQHDSTVELCKYLVDEFHIEQDSLGFNVYYEGTKNFEGIVTRSNYSHDYTDLNPSFNFKKFLKDLNIDYETYN